MTAPRHEILFEFRKIGDYVKVSAVDPVSNTEVSIVGSSRTSHETLKASALRKLLYVMKKNTAAKIGD